MAEHWSKYDLNLMRTFVAVYESRSVTIAAEQLYISQPSVSYALAKLRKLFSDPLFQRGASGLEATPVAHELYPDLRQALTVMDAAVSGSADFDPATTTRTFRLMMTDLGLMALFPYIVEAIEERAPRARLEVIPLDAAIVVDSLRKNDVDAAVAIPTFDDPQLLRDHLMDMPYVGACAIGHPRIGGTPTMTELANERHIFVSDALGHERVMQRLTRLGVRADTAIWLPYFATIAQTLAVTDHVSVLPLALADIFAAQGTARQFQLPVNVEPGSVALYTYRRPVPSPPIEWLRETISESLTRYPYPKHPAAGQGRK